MSAGIIVYGDPHGERGRCWWPAGTSGRTPWCCWATASCLRHVPRAERWRGGLPLAERATIFPEDVRALTDMRVDVLVTHEAPSTHRHGFVGIDIAAAACRARLVVHGHHHESVEGTLPDGTPVRGLARAEVLRLRAEDVR